MCRIFEFQLNEVVYDSLADGFQPMTHGIRSMFLPAVPFSFALRRVSFVILGVTFKF